MKTKLTLFAAVLAVSLFGMGCASPPAFVSDGLVAYYPFNGNAKDESGNGNDGDVNGATLSLDRHGVSDAAFSFDGNHHIDIGNSKSLRINNGTISAWVYSDSFAGAGGIVSYMEDAKKGRNGYAMWTSTGLSFILANNEGYREWKHAGKLEESKWYHVAVSFNDTVSEGYINGIMIKGINHHGLKMSFTKSSKALIGLTASMHQYEHNFKGSIDDVRIYNRALSAAEVKALYDLEKPKTK